MHISSSFHRKTPCHLLRESYWQHGKVRKRTLANLSSTCSASASPTSSPPVAPPSAAAPPLHSFEDLLQNLAGLTAPELLPGSAEDPQLPMVSLGSQESAQTSTLRAVHHSLNYLKQNPLP